MTEVGWSKYFAELPIKVISYPHGGGSREEKEQQEKIGWELGNASD